MDIDGNPDGTEAESDAVQLERYQRIFPVFWEHTSVEGVTLWGWRPGLWRNDQEAFLVRNNGEERPALEWLRAYVDSAQVSVGIEDLRDGLPVSHRLYNNYPNPFNPTTQIKYDVAKASDVNIKVYDITGRLVQTLVDNRQASGTYTVSFDASGLSTGVYFYRIQAGSFMDVKQMMLIK
ncbi:MAG: T9SS type A sorting domain-containing protein, partial [Balneolaceae bacterium]